MAFDIDYFLKINNTYGTKSQKDVQLYNLKNQVNDRFSDTIDCYSVKLNDIDRDLLIIRTQKQDEKTIKSRPDEDFNIGDYVTFESKTWLIISKDECNQTYTTGTMKLTNYALPFQHPKTGAILSYPCIDETSSSVGLDENKFITTGDATHTIKLPFDDNTQLLIEGDRLIIDKRNIDVPTVYKVTKVNTTEYNYGDKGLIELVLAQDKFNESADNLELKICNYFEPSVTPPEPDPTIPTIVTTITCTSHTDFANKTKLGVNYTFGTTFKNELGVPVENTQPVYSVDNKYDGKVVLTDNGDGTCSLKVGTARDLSLCTKQFTFTCMDMRSGFSSSILLTIVGLY